MKKLRIAFMGTPDFAAVSLQALIDSHHDIVCVYSQPPRPKGRGHKVQQSPVHMLAEQHNIDVLTPHSLKDKKAHDVFAAYDVDVAIVAAYGLILPQAILDIPRHGCLNIHASLLPRWRGASPIQRAILAGDEETGITIMQMDRGLDTGDMIAKSSMRLLPHMTALTLHDALAEMGGRLLMDVLETLLQDGALQGGAQNNDDAIYAHLLRKEDGIIDWKNNAVEIDRKVRALNPWPGVWAEIQGRRFKVHDVSLADVDYPHYAGALCDEGLAPGAVLNKDGLMLCGAKTVLKINKLQPEGKKPMEFSSALNGGYINVYQVFG